MYLYMVLTSVPALLCTCWSMQVNAKVLSSTYIILLKETTTICSNTRALISLITSPVRLKSPIVS